MSVIADTIVRTVELGVTITDAALDGDTTVVFCDLVDRGPQHCPGCGRAGLYRDTVERRVTDVPVAGHPLLLRVRVRRYQPSSVLAPVFVLVFAVVIYCPSAVPVGLMGAGSKTTP